MRDTGTIKEVDLATLAAAGMAFAEDAEGRCASLGRAIFDT